MILNIIRKSIRRSDTIRRFVAYQLAPSGLFDNFILNKKLSPIWEKRLSDTVRCTDNKYIARVSDAGKVIRGKQIMHNGLKIHLGSYYGPEVAIVLQKNKGVHEPQEERVFAEVLKVIPKGGTMIELGSFWSFYSMWFNSEVEKANNYMVEPDTFNMGCGKRNFILNNMKGDFTNAFVGKSSIEGNPPTICIDNFMKDKNIDFVNILHSDIQGYEYDMLQGAKKTIDSNKVGFVFVSTHSNEVHAQCLNFLKEHDFFIIAEHDLDNTYSQDGLIVASSPITSWKKKISISKK